MNSSSIYLDGNAAAGPLADLLRFDITATVGRCASCHGNTVMAQGRVYSVAPGLVLRCPSCDHVLIRMVVAGDRVWLDMTGLACLRIDRTDLG